MSLDLEYDDAQRAIAASVAQFCRDHAPDEVLRASAGKLPAELWRGLAALGVLGLGAPDEESGALEVTAAMEALGRAVFPGPLAATFFAVQLLPEAERAPVVAGEAVVSLGTPPLLPWAPVAALFLETDGERVWLAQPRGGIEPVETLGGEPWGRCTLARTAELGPAGRPGALFDAALAAYLAAAATRLVEAAAEHARTRVQFGRPVGEFQAVAHPLADRAMQAGAAATLARAAAFALDRDDARAGSTAAAARLSAGRAALAAACTAHQVFGAQGAMQDGPVFFVSRHVRQLVSLPPDQALARERVLERFGLGGP